MEATFPNHFVDIERITKELRYRFQGTRTRVPTVLQMEGVECGAAALAMILAHFGTFIPLEKLRVDCGVSRDGSKASNLLKAARKHGLKANGFRKEPVDLESMKMPVIAFWNFNHFLVLEGFKGGRVYLNDPGIGPRVVTREEFDEAFTGVVLTFEPSESFVRGGHKPSVLRSLGARLVGSKLALLHLLLGTIALVVPNLVIPLFSRMYVDRFLIARQTGWIGSLLFAMGATLLMKLALTWIQQETLLRLETKLALSSSARFLRHVFRLPMEFFAQRYPGEIASRVESNDRVATLLSGDLATNGANILLVGFYFALMLQYDVRLTLIAAGVSAANLLALRLISRQRVDDNRRLFQEQGRLMGTAMSGLQMIETLKATGSENDFFSRWSGFQAKVLNAQQNLAVRSTILAGIPPLLTTMCAIAVLSLGSLRVMDGVLTIGMLLAFQTLVQSFVEPVNKLVDLGARVQEAQADLTRLDDVLRYEIDSEFREDAPKAWDRGERLRGHVELNNVTFGYSRLEAPLIMDFSLTVQPGARIALVGGSGSGKSTIARIICGLHKPWSGEVLFDGVPRSEVPHDVVVNSVSNVDQEIFLFEGSIRENLAMWDQTIEETTLVKAAKDAAIHDDITKRPGAYDARVEERGRNFSGGQRQRLEIARALSMNPRILVLDEATSALDPVSEQLVGDALRKRGCTCIIVAHRLSTIRDADEIIVLDRGRVVERGTHEQLVGNAGYYFRLIGTH